MTTEEHLKNGNIGAEHVLELYQAMDQSVESIEVRDNALLVIRTDSAVSIMKGKVDHIIWPDESKSLSIWRTPTDEDARHRPEVEVRQEGEDWLKYGGPYKLLAVLNSEDNVPKITAAKSQLPFIVDTKYGAKYFKFARIKKDFLTKSEGIKELYVVLRHHNDYDQHGAYFVGVYDKVPKSPSGYWGRQGNDGYWFLCKKVLINTSYEDDSEIHEV